MGSKIIKICCYLKQNVFAVCITVQSSKAWQITTSLWGHFPLGTMEICKGINRANLQACAWRNKIHFLLICTPLRTGLSKWSMLFFMVWYFSLKLAWNYRCKNFWNYFLKLKHCLTNMSKIKTVKKQLFGSFFRQVVLWSDISSNKIENTNDTSSWWYIRHGSVKSKTTFHCSLWSSGLGFFPSLSL